MFQSKKSAYVPQRKSHRQKKYFSLMLVPAYTSGKTRSIRISIRAFYITFFVIVSVLATLLFLHFQSMNFVQAIMYTSAFLEETEAAYQNLQEEVDQEQNQLTVQLVSLQNNLNIDVVENQRELLIQQRDFIDELAYIRAYAESLETRLWQYEIYRQEIISRLSQSAHLPVVSNVLNEMYQVQLYLLSDFFESPPNLLDMDDEEQETILLLGNTSSIMFCPEEIEYELIQYIAALELALEAQAELYSQLKDQVSEVAPHIRRDNYGPRLLDWSYVRNILPQHTPVRVTDVRTGAVYYIISFSHGNHADVITATAEDTAIFHRTFGGRWSWDTRPVWVHINGRKVAASINGMPHAGTPSRTNNMNGHVCIHFRGSRTHSGSRFHERDHQNSVMEAYRSNNF